MAKERESQLPPLSEILEEDDASRAFDQMTAEERRPTFMRSKLPSPTWSFTATERELAHAIFSSVKMPGEWPR